MIEVKMPSEIKDYKSKLIFGLTTRQFISVAGAMAVCVPIAIVGKEHLQGDILPWIIMMITAVFVAFGFFKYKDMNFEEYVKTMFLYYAGTQKRVYEDTNENLFTDLHNEISAYKLIKSGEIEDFDEYDVE